MGFNDRYPDDYIEHDVMCNLCGKHFRFKTENQIPGFRQKDGLFCPYCGEKLAESMKVEYFGIEKLDN